MKKFLLLTIMMMATALAGAQIIHVPGDYPTIQQGIDAAQFFGDTVLVEDGTYQENISFNGKFITVASHYIIDQDTNHINNTIIDGSNPSNPDYGSVVRFISGEDTNSVICGFTITGGSGMYVPVIEIFGGGGIGIDNFSGAKILNNHIDNNNIITNIGGSGGGIGAGDASNINYVVIKNNRICNNSVIAHGGSEGGGMAIFCNAIIKDNVVCNNTVSSETYTAVGGGIRVIGYYDERYVECTGNLIANNTVTSSSSSEYAGAGGLQINRCYGNVSNNIIKNNIIEGTLGSIGAGIFNAHSTSTLIFQNNQISENYSNYQETEGKGGGMYLVVANPILINNIISHNYASLGGGIYSYLVNDSPTQLINNTIAYNQDGNNGGGVFLEDADMVILNSILWNNENYEDNEIAMTGISSIEAAHSDVSGGWDGENNIDDDPLFINELCFINTNSPCHNMGIDEYTLMSIILSAPDNDIVGKPRPYLGGIDMGAFEGDLPQMLLEPSTKDIDNVQVSPNPSHGNILLQYRTENPATIHLTVLNLTGTVVLSKAYNKPLPGDQSQSLDLSFLPEGCYLLKIQSGNYIETKKVIIH